MPIVPDLPLVFVDLETTGATATSDRITEIGIVEVDGDTVSEWSTLVNPGCRIPEFIERLTGIRTGMVAAAPRFEELAAGLLERLNGRLFVAHNARFDYGFLKNEFRRCGIDFRAPVLCTVKLSRRLYPGHARHSLDALIERHGLAVADRHRALGDARLIHRFWRKAIDELGHQAVADAVAQIGARPSLPPHLDPDLVDRLPEGHGVYLFYAENDLPLYVGKSNSLKKRVLAHFAADHANAKEMSLSLQVRRIDWIETAGELGALLLEARLVKELQPTHNRRLRRQDDLCTWTLEASEAKGLLRPRLLWLRDLPPGDLAACHGLFGSPRSASSALSAAADEHGLCRAVLGLEKVKAGKPCFGVQLHTCTGACVGTEAPASHNRRVLDALAGLKLREWPYSGPVAIREGDELHVVDRWCYLGSARNDEDVARLLERKAGAFDPDMYKVLGRFLARSRVHVLAG